MEDWYQGGKYCLTTNAKYVSYLALLGPAPRDPIATLVWTGISLPKYRFIMWLSAQEKLLTKDRLCGMGIHCDSPDCCLCDADVLEDAKHLFVEYS